jgi:hypothetical protein
VTSSLAIAVENGGSAVINARNVARAFNVRSPSPTPIDVAITGITVEGGTATSVDPVCHAFGGAICILNANLTLAKSTLQNGHANLGGAIAMESGTCTIRDSTIANNMANTGGGIVMQGGTLRAIASTLNANKADDSGGAIAVLGGALDLRSCTLSDNTAVSGGGLFFAQQACAASGACIVNNVTLASNKEYGWFVDSTASGLHVAVSNTILALNTPADCSGTLGSAGHNLLQNDELHVHGRGGDITGKDPDSPCSRTTAGRRSRALDADDGPAVNTGADTDSARPVRRATSAARRATRSATSALRAARQR